MHALPQRRRRASWPSPPASLATSPDEFPVHRDAAPAPLVELAGAVPAALHFAVFLDAHVAQAALGKPLSNPWLSARHEQEVPARQWLLAHASEFVAGMETAFFESSDEEVLALLDRALEAARNTSPIKTTRHAAFRRNGS